MTSEIRMEVNMHKIKGSTPNMRKAYHAYNQKPKKV
jgi:hypothetical protein